MLLSIFMSIGMKTSKMSCTNDILFCYILVRKHYTAKYMWSNANQSTMGNGLSECVLEVI